MSSILTKKDTQNCNICYDTMNKGIVKLNCGHELCALCFSNHIRENNNCPFCRFEICKKPKKITKMCASVYHGFIIKHLSARYLERDKMTITEFVESQMNLCYKNLNLTEELNKIISKNKKKVHHNILYEFQETIKDVIHDIETYYIS